MVETRDEAVARSMRQRRAEQLAAAPVPGQADPLAAFANETGFDPALFERLAPAPDAHVRAVVLTLGVATVTGGATILGHALGLPEVLAVLAALPIGVSAGFLFALGIIVSPARRAAEHRRRLIERIEVVAGVEREEAFALLLRIDEKHELAALARTIHDALSTAHADRLEAARLRRDMTHRVERQSQKNTAHLTRLTTTDELSGLMNRRGFEQALTELVERARRESTELTLIAFDMDHFKRLNDTHGHDAGDRAIAAVGDIMRAHVRGDDVACRIGGDEFVVLLFNGSPERGLQVAERLAGLFRNHPGGIGIAWPTLSAGIASLNADGAGSAAELRRMADEALYASKRNGRAQICNAGGG